MHERPDTDTHENRHGDTDDERGDRPGTPLTDERRRFLLRDLTAHYHPVPTYDLADRLRAFEHTADRPISFDEVHRQLVEEHLPRLEAAGLVETAGERGRYVPTDETLDTELTVRHLEATDES
ncbi:DUF7344 domain-containing protein [Halomarina rubra]|uniref:DUF7344 domain-containing protein n=1 Tax=Halomarina rubra TaxID=2071873 RepID=A0ABD6AR52_9EURY|nr:hypothetical protein [Halomarina rubra]